VNVYDGLNATGNLLASLNLSAQYANNCAGDPSGSFCNWTAVGATLAESPNPSTSGERSIRQPMTTSPSARRLPEVAAKRFPSQLLWLCWDWGWPVWVPWLSQNSLITSSHHEKAGTLVPAFLSLNFALTANILKDRHAIICRMLSPLISACYHTTKGSSAALSYFCAASCPQQLCCLHRNLPPLVNDAVVGIHIHQLWLEFLQFQLVVHGIGAMMTRSPGFALCAAAPFTEIMPEPRCALMDK